MLQRPMLICELTVDHVYLACVHTDMRKSIDGLASVVQSRFQLDPHQPALFLFCGRLSMGCEKIRTEVQFILATVKIIDFYRKTFQCLECRKQEHFSIEKPAKPQPVLAKSIASPSSIAHVITQKYQFAMPLYRQEQEWKAIGIALLRATLANWVIRAAQDWLVPLVDRMHQLLLLQPIIHADETPVQVLGEKGRKNKTKSYMWVFTNGEYEQEGHQIRIYKYQPERSGSFAGEFLKEYKGTLQTDGYAGYEQVAYRAHALCWAHARRYFVEALPRPETGRDRRFHKRPGHHENKRTVCSG